MFVLAVSYIFQFLIMTGQKSSSRVGAMHSGEAENSKGRSGKRAWSAWLVMALALLLGGCSTPKEVAELTPLAPPQPYTRINKDKTNTVALQIAVRKLVPQSGRGPAIWLVGTSHVGDTAYYQGLQKQLDAQTVVLYEGVNAEAHERRVRGGDKSKATSSAKSSAGPEKEEDSIQATLAHSLGLVFQLDAIDYDRTNFLNSDLSIQQIQALMMSQATNGAAAGAGKGEGNQSFSYLLQIMDGSSFMGSMMRMGMNFIGSSPKLQAMTKLTLIEMLGQLKGELTEVKGMPEDLKQLVKVLIESRNEVVVEDLQKETKKLKKSGSVAVFYGTGHMPDMEKRITQVLKYKPAEEIWYTAFSVDTKTSGLSESEIQMVQNLVKWQMDQLQQK